MIADGLQSADEVCVEQISTGGGGPHSSRGGAVKHVIRRIRVRAAINSLREGNYIAGYSVVHKSLLGGICAVA